MFYLDTSFVIPLFIKEANSPKVRGWLDEWGEAEIALSDWTCTEFASAMGVNVRAGMLSATTVTTALELFEAAVAESFTLLLPARDEYTLARTMLARPKAGLRAGDALHLAITANRGAEKLMTFDHRMRKAAKTFGVPVG
jgi:predicted nucleic acid-binding protein